MLTGLLTAATAAGMLPTPMPGLAEPLLSKDFGQAVDGVRRMTTERTWKSVDLKVKSLRPICNAYGGKLKQVAEAKWTTADPEFILGGEKVAISRAGLWRIAGLDARTYERYTRSSWVYDRIWTIRDHYFKSFDPFGVYGCEMKKGGVRWAIAVMPNPSPPNNAGELVIFELTPGFLKALKSVVDTERSAWERAESMRQESEAQQRQAQDESRLTIFRSLLTVGSMTNCGMILQMRGPIAEVQLPGGVVGPAGEKQFWVRRNDLTDERPPNGCAFGR